MRLLSVLRQVRLSPDKSFLRSPKRTSYHQRTFSDLARDPSALSAQSWLRVSKPSWSADVTLPYVWFRDNCRCDVCYNHETRQKLVSAVQGHSIQPATVCVNEESLDITWKDGHQSVFELKWLWKNSYEAHEQMMYPELCLWDKYILGDQLPSVEASHMTSDHGTKDFMTKFLKWGFCLVNNVEPTLEATKQLIGQLGCPSMGTLWNPAGEMWKFENDHSEEDMFSGTTALAAHTDCTYLFNAPGGQVFHCLRKSTFGGETLLVDGFHIASILRRSDPKAYDILSSVPIYSSFSDSKGRHYLNLDTIFKHHPITKELVQFRLCRYDVSSKISMKPSLLQEFYRAYSALLWETEENSTNQVWLSLSPGQVLFIDNWRVMHGRAAFVGTRHICGCYLDKSDLLNRARMLQLIP